MEVNMRKRDVLQKYSKVMKRIIKMSHILPKGFYLWLLKKIRTYDTSFFIFIRFICLKNCAKSCGDNVAVFSNVYLYRVDKLIIGDNVSIHPMCYIDAGGELFIGDDVSIAHNTSILTEEHIYSDLDLPIKDQGCEFKRTVIHSNVWIGAGCRILAGGCLESGSIIAAGAVVTSKVSKNEIVGGVPARLIKERK